MVIRVGYSRNPESDTSGRNQMPPGQVFPATIILKETTPNTYTSVGSLSDGVTIVPQFDLTVWRCEAQRRTHDVSRGVHSWEDHVVQRERADAAAT